MFNPTRLRAAAAAFALAAATPCALAQSPAASADGDCAVELEVQNLVPNKGSLYVSAYGDGATFFKKPFAATAREVGGDATMLIKLCSLPAGDVSLIVFQDVNVNGKLDRNPIGIPTEPWGASGSPNPFGPPTWDATKVPARGRIVIKL